MSSFAFLQATCLIALALLLIAAGWQDIRTLRIADGLSLSIVAAFLVWALAGAAAGRMTVGDAGLAVACAAAMFLAGAAAFAAGAMGGGDVKLLAATSLFAGPGLIPDFLMITALAGGLLGLAILAGAPIGPALPQSCGTEGCGTVRTRLRASLPYGPAIAAGGLWVAAALALAMRA